MIRKKHNITNSCPMCGKSIVEEDISKHRCDSLAAVINNSPDPKKAADDFMKQLDSLTKDYSWIKVKRYVDDESLTWEERYARLMKHHEEETTFLINEVNKLRNK
jgi:hypothetical protein